MRSKYGVMTGEMVRFSRRVDTKTAFIKYRIQMMTKMARFQYSRRRLLTKQVGYGDDGQCGVAVALVLRAGRQNNQDFSAKITKISVRYERRYARFLLHLPPCTRASQASTAMIESGHLFIGEGREGERGARGR